MSGSTILLRIDGEVAKPRQFTFADLEAFADSARVVDVTRHGAKRGGDAILLSSLLDAVDATANACYLGLHSHSDNFHASIPLEPVRPRAFLIYRQHGAPLSPEAGGPLRFFVPDHAACHTDEIDECANVKFVEHLELTAEKGFDNRPLDDEEHARLHEPN